VQYNNFAQRSDFSLRFHWISRIGDDVFIFRNSGYSTAPDATFRFPSVDAARRPLNGALIIKGTHGIAL
jgi:hypothetical protein